jgi:hypothetical protein
MILSGILWFLTWPIIILASYFLVRMALKKFEKKLEEGE